MASASSRGLPHVTAGPERPSSRLDQHVRVPSGSGSTVSVARDFGRGDEFGGPFGHTLGNIAVMAKVYARL